MNGSSDDLAVASTFIEPERCETVSEMGRQFCFDVDHPAVGSIDPDPPGMKMELAADAASQESLRAAIFCIPDDWMTDRVHVSAELVSAAGERLQF
jgi:hypothetical protein